MDQYLYPFYKADIEAGRLTEEEAQELLDCLWVKFSEQCLFQDQVTAQFSAGYPMFQNVCCGGVDERGMIYGVAAALGYVQDFLISRPCLSATIWRRIRAAS
jgi:pyruvate-formate lyase